MSTRRVIALGTSSQVPTRKRNHSGYFLAWDDRGLLFDPGEGTQRQMIFFGVAASDIHIILITHLHGDHCLGLPGILQRLSLDRVQHTVDLIYPASGKPYIDNLKNASIFYNTLTLREHPVTRSGLALRDLRFDIEAYALDHAVDCFGYRIREPDSISMRTDVLAQYGIVGPEVGRLKRQGFLDLSQGRLTLGEASTLKIGMSSAVDALYVPEDAFAKTIAKINKLSTLADVLKIVSRRGRVRSVSFKPSRKPFPT